MRSRVKCKLSSCHANVLVFQGPTRQIYGKRARLPETSIKTDPRRHMHTKATTVLAIPGEPSNVTEYVGQHRFPSGCSALWQCSAVMVGHVGHVLTQHSPTMPQRSTFRLLLLPSVAATNLHGTITELASSPRSSTRDNIRRTAMQHPFHYS
jgi:hypothetical protein